MKSLISTLLFLIISIWSIKAQNSVLDGKITIADDKTLPVDGTVRFNSETYKYEGYVNQQWVNLSFQCVCPYVLAPFDDVPVYSNYNTTQSGQLIMYIEFSHRMNPSSFIYGTNVIVSANIGTSTSGTLVWSKNNTRLTITTDEPWTSINNNCYSPWNLQIIGTGNNPVRGMNSSPLDGDRDGCCGGDYTIQFQLLC